MARLNIEQTKNLIEEALKLHIEGKNVCVIVANETQKREIEDELRKACEVLKLCGAFQSSSDIQKNIKIETSYSLGRANDIYRNPIDPTKMDIERLMGDWLKHPDEWSD